MENKWPEYRISDICSSVSDTFREKCKEVVLINTSDVLEGKILNNELVPNENLKGQFKKKIKYKDILFSEIRPANKRFAFVDIKDTSNYIASTKLMVLRANTNVVTPEFLYYLLTSQDIIDELQHLAETRSGTFPQITFGAELGPMKVHVPPIYMQKQITSLLCNIDSKIEINKKISDNLFAQMNLIIDDFLEKLESYKIQKLSEVAYCQNGYAFYKDGYDESGAFVIDLGNVNLQASFTTTSGDKYINLNKYNSIKMEKFRVYKDDLIMVMTDRKSTMDLLGKTGKIIRDGFYLLNQRMYRIRAKECINVNYLYSYINSSEVNNYIKSKALGSVQKYINTDVINEIQIKVPSPEKMEQLSDIVDPMMGQIENITFENEELIKIRDELHPKLMHGLIDATVIDIEL